MPQNNQNQIVPIRQALVSVSNKEGLIDLAKSLKALGVKIFCTQGSSEYLGKNGVETIRIETVTQFPEMMDGRVKTLHPKIFGGILARRYQETDLKEAETHKIPLFDLVIVNLYPFWEHLGKPPESQSSFVDIGGPSLMRAAAKNFDSVTILSSPDDYASFQEEIQKYSGSTSREFRFKMAGHTFKRTSEYDLSIALEWSEKTELPNSLSFQTQQPLRYGENPHQKAAWASTQSPAWKVLQGKELSYNNLLDSEAALRVTSEFTVPTVNAVCIVKHNNPCGVATSNTSLAETFQRAFEADSKSAFGGIVSLNRPVDGATAQAMSSIFLEVVISPSYTQEALEIFAKKKNLRLIEWSKPEFNPFELRAAMGGWLIQSSDGTGAAIPTQLVTKTKVASNSVDDLSFAWKVVKHVRSNAIVIAKNGTTLGIGGGQTSRVESVEIALRKAENSPAGISGSVLASDAFFPFRDNIDLLKGKKIAAIIQPGGSQRDAEVIDACDELGIAMVFTAKRHFRH
jgi:phosphoribosylaminoimidazolecarboxamide formyltransferase / IMP cyclohydrolase